MGVSCVWAICWSPHEEYVCMHACTWYLGHLLISIWRICVCACRRVPGVWAICQLSCENVCAWCLSHLHVKTMHSSVSLVFGPSASLREKCAYVVFGLSAMWRTCLYLVLGHLHFCVKNVRVPYVCTICQLPREEYACVHPIFRPSAHYHVHTQCLGHLPTSTWRICMCAPNICTLPGEYICTHLSWRMCIHAIWCLGHLPTSMWRICTDAFMYSADFCEEYALCVCASCWLHVCNMCIYVMRTSMFGPPAHFSVKTVCVYTHMWER